MILDAIEVCEHINSEVSTFIYNIIRIIKLGVPIILAVIGMIDFGKAVYATKEDEATKARKDFIKRIIAGAAVFLMITITQMIIAVIDRNSSGNIWDCANKIMNGEKNEDSQQYIDIKKYCCESSGAEFTNRICKMTSEQRPAYDECIKNKNVTGNNGQTNTSINGTVCRTTKDDTEYNLCLEKTGYNKELPLLQDPEKIKRYEITGSMKKYEYINDSMIELNNKNICGTIFKNICNYNYTILWSEVDGYDQTIVNNINWNSSLENIEMIKKQYYSCYSDLKNKKDTTGETLEKECDKIFSAFYE